MRKAKYLSDPSVRSFVRFVRDMVVQGCPGVALRIGPPGHRVEVDTLVDVWMSDGGRGGCPAERAARLTALRRELGACLKRCATARGEREQRLRNMELLLQSTKVLKVVGIHEDGYRYLLSHAQDGNLWERLTKAAALLDTDVLDLPQLSSSRCSYDFGLSGVYSLMNRSNVIYDDRLGAALGLLCRWHLERENRWRVPDCLQFIVGGMSPFRRNPSAGRLLFSERGPGPVHARCCVQAGWIVDTLARDQVISDILRGTPDERLRQLETTLWVLGDDVGDQVSLAPRRPFPAPRHPARKLRN